MHIGLFVNDDSMTMFRTTNAQFIVNKIRYINILTHVPRTPMNADEFKKLHKISNN